jgi:hypothetical protein
MLTGDSSVGRAVDCRSTGRVFKSPSPERYVERKKFLKYRISTLGVVVTFKTSILEPRVRFPEGAFNSNTFNIYILCIMAKTRKQVRHSKKQKKANKTIMKRLRKAISRVNKTARIAARTIERPVLKITRKGLGIILKPRLNFKRKTHKRKTNKRKTNKRKRR